MKSLCKKSLLATVLVAVGCFFYGCSDEEDNSVSPQLTDFTVRVNNGYLEFKDQKTFDELANSLSELDDESLANWESQFANYTSMRSMAVQAEDAQETWYDNLENLSKSELIEVRSSGKLFYSEFIIERPNIFILRDSGRYFMNLPMKDMELEAFINSDGLLKVGNELREYTKESVKIIRDGDESKLNLLAKVDESDNDLNIAVHHIRAELVEFGAASGLNARFANNASCTGTVGIERVVGEAYRELDSSVNYFGNGDATCIGAWRGSYYFNVNMYALRKKGLFGGWIQKRTKTLRATGTVTVLANLSGNETININVVQSNFRYKYFKQVWASPQICATGYDVLQLNYPRFEGEITFTGRGGTECTI